MFMRLSRSGMAVLVGAVALVLCAFVATPFADVSNATISACVKGSGGVHFITATHTKCKTSESLLSWSTEGASGKEGKEGKEGPPGKSVGAAGYSVHENSVRTLGGEEPFAEKTLPAGSYIISADVSLFASAASATRAGAICTLFDSPGEPLKTSSALIDKAIWTVELAENPETTHFEGASSVPLLGAVTTTEPTTVSVVCRRSVDASGLSTDVYSAVITAVQTSGNS